jgi:nucleolar GTP-binding protein
VADYIDPEIEKKLAELEEEEARLEAEGYYDSDEDIEDEEEEMLLMQADQIREQHQLIRNESRLKKGVRRTTHVPRPKMRKSIAVMDDALDRLGVDTSGFVDRVRSKSRVRGRSTNPRSRTGSDAMDVDPTPRERLSHSLSRARTRSQSAVNRRDGGIEDAVVRDKAERMAKVHQRKMNRMARQGEADRHISEKKPKFLVSLNFLILGKRADHLPHSILANVGLGSHITGKCFCPDSGSLVSSVSHFQLASPSVLWCG